MANHVKDLTGKRSGRLTALYDTGERTKSGRNVIWMCQCDCGNMFKLDSGGFGSGTIKSCGCWQKERMSKLNLKHGGKNDRLYCVWINMRRRCYDKRTECYKDYGGRGITVCDEWNNDYEVFKKWAMENGYDKDAKLLQCTLDRIDVNGNYCPENCRWITSKEQNNNRRSNRRISFQGETRTIRQWEELLGFRNGVIRKRLSAGWSVERTLTEPLHDNGLRKRFQQAEA